MSWRMHRFKTWGPKRLWQSFGYAFAGLWHCVLWEQNFRIHTVAAGLALWLGRRFALTPGQWGLLWLTIGLVLGLEALNSGLEAAIDLCCPHTHPLAKVAKDCGSGAVLLAAAASLGVAAALFGDPALWQSLLDRLLAGGPRSLLWWGPLLLLLWLYVFHGPTLGRQKQQKK